MIYPPISRRGSEEYMLGIVKTIKALAPRAAIIAVSVRTFRKISIAKRVSVARKH